MESTQTTLPFGTHALPPALDALRRWALGLTPTEGARRLTSLVRRICMLGRADPFDVEPFPGQKARLYPRDNLSEKRVFGAAQFWDLTERTALAQAITSSEMPFHFVDAGANVGLYTLAARSAGQIRGLAIEPDPENLRRLRFNLTASGAEADVTVAPVALSDTPGEIVLADAENRGEISRSTDGSGHRVPAQPLLDVISDAGFPRVDALKIDIEGMEEPVLSAYLDTAPGELWPGLILIEARRGQDTAALALLRAKGYVQAERTKLNVILSAPDGSGLDQSLEGRPDVEA